jgi:hypothetical protein
MKRKGWRGRNKPDKEVKESVLLSLSAQAGKVIPLRPLSAQDDSQTPHGRDLQQNKYTHK